MGILDWLLGYESSSTIMPNDNGQMSRMTAQDYALARQMQAMTPEEIATHNALMRFGVKFFEPSHPVWDGKLWYPLGDQHDH